MTNRMKQQTVCNKKSVQNIKKNRQSRSIIMQNSYRLKQETVLVSKAQGSLSSDHPMFYVKQKNYFLQQLSNKVAVQNKFHQLDLKRNVRVDHLIAQHEKINKDIKKEENRRKMYLSSNQFQPVFGLSQAEKARKREEKEQEELREQLYQNYVEQCIIHQQPEKDTGSSHSQSYKQFELVRKNEQLKNFTVLSDYRSDPNRKKELYLLDLQISKLKQEENLQKLVKKKQSQCSNNQLLSKISNTILSSYMVYFDEIFAALMDQMLEEEVIYLNALEASYFINGGQTVIEENNQRQDKKFSKSSRENLQGFTFGHKDSKELAQDVKALKMLQLVKCLDELAYD